MPDDSLKKLQSKILYALWKRRRNHQGGLVTPTELHAELMVEKSIGQKKSIKKIQKSLRALELGGYVESRAVSKDEESRPGPAPNGYRLPEAGRMITWQCTANIVLKLFHHPYEPVLEEAFVIELLDSSLHRDDNGQPLTKADILDQIAYCISKGYIKVTEESTKAGENVRRLHRTIQIDKERHLLEMIQSAPERKHPATEPSSSSNASDQGGLKAGDSRP